MLQTTIVNYLVPGARAAAPARTASRERQPTLKEQLRLVQSLVTQWFPFNGARGNYEIETRPDQHLVLVMRHPDLPTGDLSPLPYPQPADEQESLANIRSVLCRAARGADAFFEFHAEMAAHDDNKSSAEYNEEYYSRLAKTALWGLKQPLGPRALAYVKRELTYGGSLRYRVKPTGFGYWCSATADDSPLAILDSIMAAEAKTAVLAVADARVAAEKALFLASTAQLAHTDTVGALVALRQAQAACDLVNGAIAAMASGHRLALEDSTWSFTFQPNSHIIRLLGKYLRAIGIIRRPSGIPGTGPPYPGDYVVWALRHPRDPLDERPEKDNTSNSTSTVENLENPDLYLPDRRPDFLDYKSRNFGRLTPFASLPLTTTID
ncbi:hypothetical protein K438DRAFT_1971518 [Mycena galopus ATCC 62051]|nr:hypothetical protein K438DRAFT_1971518 [Mycena galopus ATCC 62051]